MKNKKSISVNLTEAFAAFDFGEKVYEVPKVKKSTPIKSDIETANEIIVRNNVKEIKEIVEDSFRNETDKYNYNRVSILENPIAETILEKVVRISKDFTREIAEKSINEKRNVTEKQAWEIAYQIFNNNKLYI